MAALFWSKSCGFAGITDGAAFFHRNEITDGGGSNGEDFEENGEITESQVPTSFMSPESSYGEGRNGNSESKDNNQFTVLDFLAAALRKSLVTCSVETEDVASMENSWPSEVRHVSHVTFDRFGGFLGLPEQARAGQAGGNGLALPPFALPLPCPATSSRQSRGNEKILPPCRGTPKKTGQGPVHP